MSTPDIDKAHDNARAAHREAYLKWRYSNKLLDAVMRDSRRTDLRLFGYTPEEVKQIEAEIDSQR